MSLEAATYVNDLQTANPLSTDRKGQGDDHIRLLKTVLKATFPTANRAFYFPTLTGVAVDTVIAATADDQILFASAAINLTLPVAPRQGWSIRIAKSALDNNPVFVLPPSGTINGYAKIRLNVPYEAHHFVWAGTTYIKLSPVSQAGHLRLFAGPTAPFGFAFATGQSLLRADYPELFTEWGTTWGAADGTHFNAPDLRDRFITGAGSSYALAATGGEATHTLLAAEMPVHAHGITQNPHDHAITSGTTGQLQNGVDTLGGTSPLGTGAAPDAATANADITINNAGSGSAHENRPPYTALNYTFRLC